ncbi:MAG: FtsW/RodA/SpoVE family cell cycle protein [Chlorobi bacterium]|nr:FtsW/RodA/SpoVE family cell cycle protein [Chlorobiota bacterium]
MSRQKLDWWVLVIYLIISIWSVLTLYFIDVSSGESSGVWQRQAIWLIVSLLIGFVILMMDSQLILSFSPLLYALAILLMIAAIVQGQVVRNIHAWVVIGGFRFQPVELAKVATALMVARWVSRRKPSVGTAIKGSLWAALPAVLALAQKDWGSAMTFSAVPLALTYVGFPWVLVIAGIALYLVLLAVIAGYIKFLLILYGVVLSVLIFVFRKQKEYIKYIIGVFALATLITLSMEWAFTKVLKPYQQQRLKVLVGQEKDPRGAAYNVIQAENAIAYGGLTGTGLGQGFFTSFKFVPEQTTDFIFCAVAEETGFIGGTLLILLYAVLILRMITYVSKHRSSVVKIYAHITAAFFLIHILINLGMVLGLLPVIGIPLPLFSYGGSQMLSFSMMIFIYLNFSRERYTLLR